MASAILSTLVWDLGRFGVQIVASPRHADGLIITGAWRFVRDPAVKTYVAEALKTWRKRRAVAFSSIWASRSRVTSDRCPDFR
jgi:Ni,Fe-hydrogenase III small subunit